MSNALTVTVTVRFAESRLTAVRDLLGMTICRQMISLCLAPNVSGLG